jgi:uncharacterized protein (TIGR03437 family)
MLFGAETFRASPMLPAMRLARMRWLGVFAVAGGLFYSAAPASAQVSSLNLSSATGGPGTTVSLALSFSAGSSAPAALQWTLVYPLNKISAISETAGPAAAAARKTLSCASSPGALTCVLSGLNTNAIAGGVVANLQLTLAVNATTTSISFSNPVAIAATGSALPALTTTGGGVAVPVLSPVTCTPGSLSGGKISTCSTTLNMAAPPGGIAISLASDNSILTVPASVTVAAGATAATFSATAAASIASNQSATVTATLGASSQTATINLLASAGVLVSGLACNPTSLSPSAVSTCTVTLTQTAPTGGSNVTLASNETALAVPASVTVPAGTTTATFSATAAASIASNQSATVAATLGSSSKTATISLVATGLISGVACSPTGLGPGTASTCTVTLTQAAPRGGSSVMLASNNTLLTVPASVTVPAGATTATFTAAAAASLRSNQGTTASTVGLVAYWTFDEISGTIAYDASGNGNNGMLECNGNCAPLPSWTTGKVNGALDFSIPNDFVSVPDTPLLELTNQFTFSFWVKASAGAANIAYVQKVTGADVGQGSGVSNGYLIATGDSGYVYINLYNHSAGVARCNTAAGALHDQTWQHYAITYDGANIIIYLNGVQNAVCSATGIAGKDSTPLSIGGINRVSPTGVMDEVRIYNRALSGQEIASVYSDPEVPATVVSVTATLGNSSQKFTLNLLAPQLVSSLGCSPTSLAATAVSTCTLTLTETAPTGGSAVTLASNNALLGVPTSVTVGAGATTATFSATAATRIASNQTATVTATAGTSSQSATINLSTSALVSGSTSSLAVSPEGQSMGSTHIQSISCQPDRSYGTCRIALNNPSRSSTLDLSLASSNRSIKPPTTITIQPGQSSARFRIDAISPANSDSTTITAQLGADVVQATASLDSRPGPLNVPAYFYARYGTRTWFRVSSSNPFATLAASGLPAGALFDPASGIFQWVPGVASGGTHHIVFTEVGPDGKAVAASSLLQVDSGTPVVTRVVNAASRSEAAGCSPGGVASLEGRWLVEGQATSDTTGNSTELSGTVVRVDGVEVPILSVSISRVDFLCPAAPPGSALEIALQTLTGAARPIKTVSRQASPGIFSLDGTGEGQGMIMHSGTAEMVMTPNYLYPSRAALPHGSVTIYATGISVAEVSVVAEGIEVTPQSIVAIPDLAGVYQVSVRLPPGPEDGNMAISLKTKTLDGSEASSNEVWIATERVLN